MLIRGWTDGQLCLLSVPIIDTVFAVISKCVKSRIVVIDHFYADKQVTR